MDDARFVTWLQKGCNNSNNLQSLQPIILTDMTRTTFFYLSIACYVLTLIAIIFNLAFLITVCKDPSLRTASLKLLTVLGVTNLLQGCISLPLTGTYLLKLSYNKNDCELRSVSQVLGNSLVLITVVNIFNITLFQYLSIAKPLKYRSYSSVNRFIMVTVIIAILNFGLAFISKYEFKAIHVFTMYLCGLGIVILIVMVTLFARMPYVIRKSRISVRSNGVYRDLRRKISDRKANVKLTKLSFVILLAFVTVYIPAIGLNIAMNIRKDFTGSYLIYLRIILTIVVKANCIIDCLVYYLMHAKIRRAIRNVFCRKRNIDRNERRQTIDIRKRTLTQKRLDSENICASRTYSGFPPA